MEPVHCDDTGVATTPVLEAGKCLRDSLEVAMFELGSLILDFAVKTSEEADDGVEEEGNAAEGKTRDRDANPVSAELANRETGPEVEISDPRECDTQDKLCEWLKFASLGISALSEQANSVDSQPQ